ncbi:C1 family peptidase, partial [Roseomonas rosulenta]|uniref:hypothetical protein n=1 Tax=Roseomonas rosulenta TaxID=2748667 RepID=UPI001E3E524E
APRRPEPGEQVIAPPQRPLPGAGLPPSLADAPARLQLLDGGVLRRWPVRNQDVHPMGCIGFATAAAVERLRMPPGGAPPELSSVFIYKRVFALFPQGNRQIQRPPGAVDGPTKFGEACAVLATDGVCPRPAWPDDAPVNRLPDAAALQAAKQSPPVAFDHWDLPPNGKRPPGAARAIHTLLDSGRAVGVALPEFKDRLSQDNMTNWRLPSNYAIGKVGEQQLGWERTNAGHAVCILGFRPDAGAPGGGWFIFRNSWGLVYAKDAPDADDPAGVPAPGYGAMSAGHADAHVWEMFSPKSP